MKIAIDVYLFIFVTTSLEDEGIQQTLEKNTNALPLIERLVGLISSTELEIILLVPNEDIMQGENYWYLNEYDPKLADNSLINAHKITDWLKKALQEKLKAFFSENKIHVIWSNFNTFSPEEGTLCVLRQEIDSPLKKNEEIILCEVSKSGMIKEKNPIQLIEQKKIDYLCFDIDDTILHGEISRKTGVLTINPHLTDITHWAKDKKIPILFYTSRLNPLDPQNDLPTTAQYQKKIEMLAQENKKIEKDPIKSSLQKEKMIARNTAKITRLENSIQYLDSLCAEKAIAEFRRFYRLEEHPCFPLVYLDTSRTGNNKVNTLKKDYPGKKICLVDDSPSEKKLESENICVLSVTSSFNMDIVHKEAETLIKEETSCHAFSH